MLLFIVIMPLVMAQTQDEAALCIDEANKTIQEMNESGLNTQRVEDIYAETMDIYVAQLALENTGSDPNYQLILSRCEQISELHKKAMRVEDEKTALKIRLDEIVELGIESEELVAKYEKIEEEYANERYETTEELIEQLYEDISEAQAQVTKVRVLYETSRRNITNFIEDNWKEIIIVIIAGLISAFLLQNKVREILIKRKKNHLLIERDILKDMIKKTQSKYFEHKTLSEGEYAIKVTKFKELIRDINRKLPVLDEQLAQRRKYFFRLFKSKEEKKESQIKSKSLKSKIEKLEEKKANLLLSMLTKISKKIPKKDSSKKESK